MGLEPRTLASGLPAAGRRECGTCKIEGLETGGLKRLASRHVNINRERNLIPRFLSLP
jgi:hypothetical protein